MTKRAAIKTGGIWGTVLRRGAVCAVALSCALYLTTVAMAEQKAPPTARGIWAGMAVVPGLGRVDPEKAQIFEKPTEADPRAEVTCLALNIYFEARSEPTEGKLAVGHVVMNRVASKRFPATACEVVREGGELRRNRCQFSWWCDGQSDTPRNRREWERSNKLALEIYWGRSQDPTDGALWYHADYVNPHWRTSFVEGPKIGRHIFYWDAARRTQLASRAVQD